MSSNICFPESLKKKKYCDGKNETQYADDVELYIWKLYNFMSQFTPINSILKKGK